MIIWSVYIVGFNQIVKKCFVKPLQNFELETDKINLQILIQPDEIGFSKIILYIKEIAMYEKIAIYNFSMPAQPVWSEPGKYAYYYQYRSIPVNDLRSCQSFYC